MPQRILILGVGNTLLGDEGFGVHALRYLEEHYRWGENFSLLDGGTLGLMLMGALLECDLAIILDIALGGQAPGTFYRIEEDALAPTLNNNQSLHQTSLSDTLISCKLAGRKPNAIIFAMEPFDIQTVRATLTDKAAARLPRFCAKVVAELEEMGIL